MNLAHQALDEGDLGRTRALLEAHRPRGAADEDLRGEPVLMHGLPVTFQTWRLPLEAGLLLAMLFLLRFPTPGAGPEKARDSTTQPLNAEQLT